MMVEMLRCSRILASSRFLRLGCALVLPSEAHTLFFFFRSSQMSKAFTGYTQDEFAVRNAVLNYILGNQAVLLSVIRKFASAPRTKPLARYEKAHDVFVSLASRLNSHRPLTEGQIIYLSGDGDKRIGLIEQHIDILIPMFKNMVTVEFAPSEADDSDFDVEPPESVGDEDLPF